MKAFTRYYEPSIKMWIENVEIHNKVVAITEMHVSEVLAYSEDLQTECRIDPAYENTYECQVLGKTVIRQLQVCRKRGDRDKPLTVGGVLGAIFGGIVMGEIASDVWSGRDGKGGVRQHL